MQPSRLAFSFVLFMASFFFIALPSFVQAGQSEIVIDLRDGTILHTRNSEEVRHPASLTKMMTLYIALDAINKGEISPGAVFVVSKKAADQPPSRMNLKAGQNVTFADLIRGTAVQSGNDGAMAIAEAVSGSESAFVERMNSTARAMGLKNTTFRNPHGLTHAEQLTTARDMGALARRLYVDQFAHYQLFGLKEAKINGSRLLSTNRRFLNGYEGATGLKTGFTRAAGYNLAASATRGGVSLLSVVMGSSSSPERYERTVSLLDWGFANASPSRVASNPTPLNPLPNMSMPGQTQQAPTSTGIAEHQPLRAALTSSGSTALVSDIVSNHANEAGQQNAGMYSLPRQGGFRPILVSGENETWGVQIGLYENRYKAEKAILETTLAYLDKLGGQPPSIVKAGDSWSAAYIKMSKRQSESACRHLMDNNVGCAIFQY